MASAGPAAASAPVQASPTAIGNFIVLSPSGWTDQEPAGHPGVLVGEHVAVVEPAPGVVFCPAGRDRLARSDGCAVHVRAVAVLRPAVPVDMEGVEEAVQPDHVHGDGL